MSRIRALLTKDLTDLRQNPGLFFPAILTGLIALLLPFVLAIGVPYFTGESLSDSSDFQVAMEMYRNEPAARALDPEGAVQAWIFQQFLVLLALTPIAASMSVAAYSVVGEKLARTLEPLLATPITTFELLSAKVLASLLPALALTAVMFGAYVLGIALLGKRGVALMMLTPQSARHHVSPGAARGSGRAVAGRVRVVAGQRRAQRPADRRAHHSADRCAAGPAADGRGSVDDADGRDDFSGAWRCIDGVLMWVGITLFDRESILTRWN